MSDYEILVHNKCEELVRYCNLSEAKDMINAKGLVRGKNGSQGAKWIVKSGSTYDKTLNNIWKKSKKRCIARI